MFSTARASVVIAEAIRGRRGRTFAASRSAIFATTIASTSAAATSTRAEREREARPAAEEAEREQRPEHDDRERVDPRVEEHQRELPFADLAHRHAEAMQHPRSDAHAPDRPARHEHAPAELRPGDTRGQVPAASLGAQQPIRVEDPAPRHDVAALRERLDEQRAHDPREADAAQALERVLEARYQLQEQVDEDEEPDQVKRAAPEPLAGLPEYAACTVQPPGIGLPCELGAVLDGHPDPSFPARRASPSRTCARRPTGPRGEVHHLDQVNVQRGGRA